MSTLPDQYTPETKWGRSEGARFRAKAATTGLVALVTLRELATRPVVRRARCVRRPSARSTCGRARR